MPAFWPQQLAGEMMRRADAGRAVAELAGILLRVGDHVRDRVDRELRVHRKADDVRARIGDRREVLHGIEADVPVEMHVARHRCVGADHQRVAIGGSARNERRADIAARAGPVVDDHRLAPGLMQPVRDGARRQVRHRARRVADHDGDGAGGIGLGERRGCGEQAGEQRNEHGAARMKGHASSSGRGGVDRAPLASQATPLAVRSSPRKRGPRAKNGMPAFAGMSGRVFIRSHKSSPFSRRVSASELCH